MASRRGPQQVIVVEQASGPEPRRQVCRRRGKSPGRMVEVIEDLNDMGIHDLLQDSDGEEYVIERVVQKRRGQPKVVYEYEDPPRVRRDERKYGSRGNIIYVEEDDDDDDIEYIERVPARRSGRKSPFRPPPVQMVTSMSQAAPQPPASQPRLQQVIQTPQGPRVLVQQPPPQMVPMQGPRVMKQQQPPVQMMMGPRPNQPMMMPAPRMVVMRPGQQVSQQQQQQMMQQHMMLQQQQNGVRYMVLHPAAPNMQQQHKKQQQRAKQKQPAQLQKQQQQQQQQQPPKPLTGILVKNKNKDKKTKEKKPKEESRMTWSVLGGIRNRSANAQAAQAAQAAPPAQDQPRPAQTQPVQQGSETQEQTMRFDQDESQLGLPPASGSGLYPWTMLGENGRPLVAPPAYDDLSPTEAGGVTWTEAGTGANDRTARWVEQQAQAIPVKH